MKCNKLHEAPQKGTSVKPSLKVTHFMILSVEHYWNERSAEMENRLMVVKERVKKTVEMEEISRQGWNMTSWSRWSDGKVLCLNSVDVLTQLWYHVAGPHWLPFAGSIFGLQSYSLPFCITELYPLTGNVPKPGKFHITFALAFIWYESWKNGFSIRLFISNTVLNQWRDYWRECLNIMLHYSLQWIYTNLLLRSHIHLFIHLFKTDFSVIYSMSNSCDWLKQKIRWCFNSLDFHSQIIKQHAISPTTLLNGK